MKNQAHENQLLQNKQRKIKIIQNKKWYGNNNNNSNNNNFLKRYKSNSECQNIREISEKKSERVRGRKRVGKEKREGGRKVYLWLELKRVYSYTRVPLLIMTRSFTSHICRKKKKKKKRMKKNVEDGKEFLECTSCWCCSSLLSLELCAPTGRHSNLLTSPALCYFGILSWI